MEQSADNGTTQKFNLLFQLPEAINAAKKIRKIDERLPIRNELGLPTPRLEINGDVLIVDSATLAIGKTGAGWLFMQLVGIGLPLTIGMLPGVMQLLLVVVLIGGIAQRQFGKDIVYADNGQVAEPGIVQHVTTGMWYSLFSYCGGRAMTNWINKHRVPYTAPLLENINPVQQ